MKLVYLIHDIPENNKPYNKISIPIGDRLINAVRNGGYNPQPALLLNSPVTDSIIKIQDEGNITIATLFILRYTTSGTPKNVGVK